MSSPSAYQNHIIYELFVNANNRWLYCSPIWLFFALDLENKIMVFIIYKDQQAADLALDETNWDYGQTVANEQYDEVIKALEQF